MKKLIIFIVFVAIASCIGYAIYYKSNEKYIVSSKKYEKLQEIIKSDKSKNENKKEKMPYDYDKFKKLNKNAYGYIRIKGTKIDYPVVKADKDNNYYLTHDSSNSYNAYGSIYVDYRCDKNSVNTIIYGHHMNNGAMFGDLINFKSYNYYKSHQKIEIWEKEKKYNCKIISCFEASPADAKLYQTSFANKDSKEEWNKYILSKKLYNTEVANEKEIGETYLLSTCTNYNSNRFIVVLEKKK